MEAIPYGFLKGGGEMAGLIAAYNWSDTPLGKIETWPESLRASLGTMLRSRFPMLIFWGPQLLTFYNDAFRTSFGIDGKRPGLLGQRGEESWAGSWPVIGPVISNIMKGGEAVWLEEQELPLYRHEKMDHAPRTYSLSAIPNGDGAIEGLLVTCTETAKNVEGLRSLKDSRDELTFAIDAAELGTWDLDPGTGRFTANARLKEWFGLVPGEEIPLAMAVDRIDAGDRQRVSEAIAKALDHSSGGLYDIEYAISHPGTAKKRMVRAKGRALFNDNKQAYRFNGTLQDVTEQKLRELAQQELKEEIEESRQQLFRSFDESPVAIATIDRHQLTFTMANRFYGELVGRKPEDIVGKPLLEALPELKGQGFDDLLNRVIDTGIAYTSKEVPVDLVRKGKLDTIYVDLVYQPQFGSDKEITGILVVATDVTEQVRSRRIIEENERKFRSLIEQAPFATALYVGENLVIDTANEAMIRLWGKDPAVIGKPLAEALPELDGQPFIGLLHDVLRTGIAYETKEQSADLVVDGRLQRFWFSFSYKPVTDMDNNVYGVLNMAVDITEQVANRTQHMLARKQLEESERFVRHIFYNSPVAKLVYIGPDMVLREANEAMFRILGRDESILNKPILESIPELRHTGLRSKYQRVLSTGEPHFEYAQRILLVKNGQEDWGYYDYIYKPLRNAQNEIYGIICTAVDVTKEVTARQRIEAAEASLRNAVELAELATWSIDIKNRAVHYSERMQDWLGVSDAELDLEASPRVHPKDRERVGQAMKEALKADGNGHFDEVYTILNRKTGQERIIHSSGRTTFDENGAAVSLSGTAQDITLQKETQLTLELKVQQRTEELAATNEELGIINEDLRRSNEELSQYAYVASHDLQEPLRKIRVFSGMLHEQKDISEQSRNYVSKINRSAERMSLLISDLLGFSRLLNSDKLKAPVDLNGVVKNVKNDFELLIDEKQALLEVEPLPTIGAVALQMNQLFYNLVSNALKFVKEGVTPLVRISSQVLSTAEAKTYVRKVIPGKTYYRISVSDNGIGFDNRYADQIFEVFKRLHGKDNYPGSGIGLALCRRIVANHDGCLYSESAVGKGSVFHVILPD